MQRTSEGDVVLGQRRVRADRAGRLARAALVDAAGQRGEVGHGRPGVGPEDALNAHGQRLRP